MAELFYDDDADLSVVQGRNVAVLGYGDQAEAQALSLRDSGVDVRVGLPQTAPSWADAEAEGLRVVTAYEACEEADLVVVLRPDQELSNLYADAIEPNLVDGDSVLFGRGFAVRYGYVKPRGGVDVLLVAPVEQGPVVRREFEEGRGVSVLVAVEQDASGKAWDLALSYAKAIGGTRAGAIRTTFAEAVEAELFGEQAVLCGGVPELVRSSFETLVAAGYQPEIAYLECLHKLKQTVDLMYEAGLAAQCSAGSGTGEYGAYSSGAYLIGDAVKQRMRRVLRAIEAGSWSADFAADQRAGAPKIDQFRRRSKSHPIEETGRELRPLMGWLRANDH